jgi:uncharacterized protein (DUF362 family)
VLVARGDEPTLTLRAALEQAGLAGVLERYVEDADARIAIKPNIMGSAGRARDATFTDPGLVEELVRYLHERGHDNLAIVESRLDRAPAVAEVAKRLGYTCDGYELIDLSDDPVELDYGGVLGIQAAGRAWVEADFRISFAKNKADRRYLWSGAMANVFGCLPRPDKGRAYAGPGHEPEECVRTLLEAAPVHFGLIDAWSSLDGSGWLRRGAVRETAAILASANVYALDWVAGEKMGVDPALNAMMQEALHRWGRIEIHREGDLTDWAPWRSPATATVVFANLIDSRRGPAWTIQ